MIFNCNKKNNTQNLVNMIQKNLQILNTIFKAAFVLGVLVMLLIMAFSYYSKMNMTSRLNDIQMNINQLNLRLDTMGTHTREVIDKMTYDQLITLENKHDKYVNELKAQNNRIEILAWAFGSITLVGLLTGLSTFLVQLFGGFNAQAKRIAEEEARKLIDANFVKEKVEAVITEQTSIEIDNLIQLTSDLKLLTHFKKMTPITIISSSENDPIAKDAQSYLNSFNYYVREIVPFAKVDSVTEKGTVLFFANVKLDDLNKWLSTMNSISNYAIFYLGFGVVNAKREFVAINYCGSLVTVSQNLNDLLLYFNKFWKSN